MKENRKYSEKQKMKQRLTKWLFNDTSSSAYTPKLTMKLTARSIEIVFGCFVKAANDKTEFRNKFHFVHAKTDAILVSVPSTLAHSFLSSGGDEVFIENTFRNTLRKENKDSDKIRCKRPKFCVEKYCFVSSRAKKKLQYEN